VLRFLFVHLSLQVRWAANSLDFCIDISNTISISIISNCSVTVAPIPAKKVLAAQLCRQHGFTGRAVFEQRRVIGRSTWFPKGRQIFAKETVYVSAADPHKTLQNMGSLDLQAMLPHRWPVTRSSMVIVACPALRLAFAGADEAARAAQFLNRRIPRSRATIGVCKNIEVVDCRVENIGALLRSMYACACTAVWNRFDVYSCILSFP
jgi:hypothetical protein